MATKRVRPAYRFPKYTPHIFRTKDESAKEYEQLAADNRKYAKGYTQAADDERRNRNRSTLVRQWRAEARKFLARAERAEQAARRMRSLGSSRDKSTSDYEMREVQSFQKDLREAERLPLSERKANLERFTETLQRDPELVAERIGWLLNGSYGRGAYTKAMQVANSPRMNQGAWLVQTVAALEWGVPLRMTAQAWHTLSAAQRKNLERLVQREISDALSE